MVKDITKEEGERMTEEDIRRLVATMKDLTPEEELAWMEKLRGAAAQLPTVREEKT